VIGAVVFDVGECLVNETGEYGTSADWLGVPGHVFWRCSARSSRGQDYRETWIRPGSSALMRVNLSGLARATSAPMWSALAQLRDEGLWVGIAGNQTARAGGILRDLGLPVDMVATSDNWGVSKPDHGILPEDDRGISCRPG
jgi:hypothetical protein